METTRILILFLLFTFLLCLVRSYYRYDNDNTKLNKTKEKTKLNKTKEKTKLIKNVTFADEENKPLETIIKIT